MRIRYSPRAAQDLAAIHDYLFERSPSGAANVTAAIYASVEFIRRNPHAAERTLIPDVRAHVVQRYRFKLFYRIASDDLIEVVHVRHTSRAPWQGDRD